MVDVCLADLLTPLVVEGPAIITDESPVLTPLCETLEAVFTDGLLLRSCGPGSLWSVVVWPMAQKLEPWPELQSAVFLAKTAR